MDDVDRNELLELADLIDEKISEEEGEKPSA